jgi:hypothetical protein
VDLVNGVGVEEFGRFSGGAVAVAKDAVGEDQRPAAGVNVDELSGEVGVDRAGRHEQSQLDRAGDLDRAVQHRGAEDQHVVARLDGTLVAWSHAVAPGRMTWPPIVGTGRNGL